MLLADFSFARSGCTLLGPLGSCTSLCLPFANFPVSPPGSEACRNTFGWWCDVFESQCQRVGGKFFEVGCGSKFLYCGHPLGFGVLDAMEVNGAGDQPQAGHQQAQPQAGQQNVQAAQFGHQQGQGSQVVPAEMVDRLVKQRIEQALGGVFGRLLAMNVLPRQPRRRQMFRRATISLRASSWMSSSQAPGRRSFERGRNGGFHFLLMFVLMTRLMRAISMRSTWTPRSPTTSWMSSRPRGASGYSASFAQS